MVNESIKDIVEQLMQDMNEGIENIDYAAFILSFLQRNEKTLHWRTSEA